jgi:hypothetical protein
LDAEDFANPSSGGFVYPFRIQVLLLRSLQEPFPPDQLYLWKSFVEALSEGVRSFPFCITFKGQDSNLFVLQHFFFDKATSAPLRDPAPERTPSGNDGGKKQSDKKKTKKP